MSFQQAFHTSCREGLGVQPGFQFNAASSGLSESDLADLAGAHAGYQTPSGAIPEPTRDELGTFPVALKYCPVDGVGPVVSCTTYVGREYRGRDGEPDSGRYGNYFSHILVAESGNRDFDGFLPIELWQAPHWTDQESRETTLETVPSIQAGSITLSDTLETLAVRGTEALAAVAGAALAAVGGGPRVVLVEPDLTLMAPWVAWASFCLPSYLASRLTFTTFSGAPVRASDVMFCVTSPDSDLSFQAYELGNTVSLLHADGSGQPFESSIYGRVAAELAKGGADPVADAVAALPGNLTPETAGAELAVATERVDLATAADIGAVLQVVIERLNERSADRWAEMLSSVKPPEEPGDIDRWLQLYRAAQGAELDGGPALVDLALSKLVPVIDRLPNAEPQGPIRTPPSAGGLVEWLEAAEASPTVTELKPMLAGGLDLGLLGLNAALDRRVAGLVLSNIADESFHPVAAKVVSQGGDTLAAEVGSGAVGLLASGEITAAVLAWLSGTDPRCREAIADSAREGESFSVLLVWEEILIGEDPARRAAAIQHLAQVAGTERDQARIRDLFGSNGPESIEDHIELLGAFLKAGSDPPRELVRPALDRLGTSSLRKDRDAGLRLTSLLSKPGPFEFVKTSPQFALWWLFAHENDHQLEQWSKHVYRLCSAKPNRVSSKQLDELLEVAVGRMIRDIGVADANLAYTNFYAAFGKKWNRNLADGLRKELKSVPDPVNTAAEAFVTFSRIGERNGNPVAEILPEVLGRFDDEALEAISSRLPPQLVPTWNQMLETHPPRSGLSRAVPRAFRSKGKR